MKRRRGVYRLEHRNGNVHVIRVSAPRSFFGVWRFEQRKPRRRASARVTCGRNGRITARWSWPAKDKRDRESHGAMLAAFNAMARRWGNR